MAKKRKPEPPPEWRPPEPHTWRAVCAENERYTRELLAWRERELKRKHRPISLGVLMP